MNKFLTPEQRDELLLELKSERYRKHADRIRVILLLDQGKMYKDIQEFYFIDEGTIRNWRKRYVEGGVERLMNDQWKAKSCALSPSQFLELDSHLQENTYKRAKDIAVYIKKKFNVDLKENSVVQILKMMGFSFKKPKKVPSKASKEKQELFIRQYNGFKGRGEVFFLDSTHPRLCPVLGYGWIKKGLDKFLPTNAGRLHLNITGAVNVKTLEIITRQSSTVNEDEICRMLTAIRGNKNPNNKIYLVLDNAAYNKSKKVKKKAKELNISLKYIPPYSPNLNLIERLWRFFREKILSLESYDNLDVFSDVCSNFFRGIRKYKAELKTLLTDSFQVVGT